MANLDALLRIKTDVQGANQIVALNRGLQGVQQTAAGASVAMRGMAGSSALLTSSLGALLPLMSAAGLVGLVKGAIDAGDAMNDLSQRTGVSVDALAKFKKAAATSGTDIDNVAKSLGRLSKGMFEAATTGKGKAADALNALGISAKDAAGNIKSADAVTLEIADRFKAMPDGVTKTALAMALFGKSGAEMIPMLNMGGAAIDSLSVKMTAAFAKKADEYRDKLAILSGKVSALGMDLTIALLPALNAVTDAVTAAVAGFNSLPPGLQQATVAAAALAIAWGPLTSAVKLGGVAIKSAGAAMEIMRYQAALAGGVMPLLAGGLDAVKVAILGIPGWGWALAGAAALGTLLSWVYKTNDGFRDFVDNLGDVISGDFKNAMQAMGNLAAGTGRFISGTWSKLVGFAQSVGSGIAQAFSGPFGFIADAARTAMGLVSGAIQNMVNAIPKPIRDKLGMAVGQAATNALFGPIGSYAIGAVGRAMSMGPRAGGAQGGGGGGIAAPAAEALDLSSYGAGGGGGGGKAKKGKSDRFELSSQGKALVAAANKLGVSPLDLATIIGFETGGSYNPSQWGGAGGNYMGLIQFGGPERRQYGAYQGQSFEEQVQGPVVRYFQDRFKGAGMSTQGATLEDLYTTVLAGNPRANRNSRDSFGTSPRSGVASMGPHRSEALRRFFGGSMDNVGYGADDAGKDAAQGYEDQRKITEETQKQLASARDLLATSEARLQVAAAMDPLEKAQVEYDQARTERMREYAEKYANVRSAQEGELLVAAQINGWALAKLELDKKMADIADQQLITERLRAEALADSLAYMQEMSSRSSVGAGLQQGLQGYVDSVGTMRDAVGKLTTDSIGGLENSLYELATTGTTNFKAFAASVLQDTSRMIIRQMVLKTIMSLIGGIGGGVAKTFEMPVAGFLGGGGGGVDFGQAMGMSNLGSVMTSPTLFKFAKGGTFNTGVMGEAGPEAIMPLRRGRDGRLGVAAAGTASSNNITINVDASGTKAEGNAGTGAALARDLARVVDDRLIHHRRPGGLLAA